MAEINEGDLFGKGVIEAPLHLAKNLGESVSQLDALIARGKEFEKIFGPTAVKSIGSVKKEVEALSLAEIELEKIQQQIAIATARDNDEYAKQVKKLKEVRDAAKEKTKVTEQEAKAVKAETASIDQLRAALERNKQSYKSLVGDQQRFSKSGKELKNVIDSQDKALKELNKTLGDHRDEVGHYELAQDGLNKVTGISIENFKQLGKSLLALASNPFFIVLTGAVALFKTLSAAANFYYTSTLEGEDAAKKSAAIWDSFFEVFRKGATEMGKDAATAGDAIKNFFADALLLVAGGQFGGSLVKERERIQKVLEGIVEDTNKVFKEHIRDIVDDANTELRVNKLLEDSKNKLKLTDEQRLEAVREAGKALTEQLQGDIELADKDIALLLKQVALRNGKIAQITEEDKETGKLITRNKTLAELTDQEILDLKLTGEEVKRLADLQVARINLESKAATQRKMLNRSEFQIVQEIETARVNKLRASQDAANKLSKERLEVSLEENKQILKIEQLSDDQQIAIRQAIGQQEVELLKKQRDEQLLIIRRSAEDRNKEMAQIMANGELEKNSKLTAGELIKIQDNFLNALISKDIAYQNERKSVNERGDEDIKALNYKTTREILEIKIDGIKEQSIAEQQALDAEAQIIKDNAIKGKIGKDRANKELLKLARDHSKDYIQVQIDEVNKILALGGLEREEMEALQKKLYELKVKYQNAAFDALHNKYEDEIQVLDNLQQVYTNFAGEIGNLFHNLTDRRLQDIDQENKAIDDQHEKYQDSLDAQLESFVGTENDKKAFAEGIRKQKEIEDQEHEAKVAELERKRIQAQRKAAIYDKAVAVIQAGILGAKAVLVQLGGGDPYSAFPRAAAAGALAAIEIAAILAKPIPQFYEGGTAPGGPIITGELGAELMREPSGKTYLSKPFANVMHGVPAGTQIMDHESTMRALALSGLGIQEGPVKNNGSSESVKMLKEIRNLNHTIKTKKETHFHFDKNGVEAYMRKSEHTIKLLNKLWR